MVKGLFVSYAASRTIVWIYVGDPIPKLLCSKFFDVKSIISKFALDNNSFLVLKNEGFLNSIFDTSPLSWCSNKATIVSYF